LPTPKSAGSDVLKLVVPANRLAKPGLATNQQQQPLDQLDLSSAAKTSASSPPIRMQERRLHRRAV